MILGIAFLIIGWRIWKKEKITLIQDYHYKNVAESDKKPYTEKMGKACIIIGLGMMLTGVIDFVTSTSFGWICFVISFIYGFILMITVQRKYNGGLF
ncbi:MAG: DUF3784 domain-containing protein [Firmicutes bacterium]|nr:DUF3784 domain-containing protein [Bacillota bacterium]